MVVLASRAVKARQVWSLQIRNGSLHVYSYRSWDDDYNTDAEQACEGV